MAIGPLVFSLLFFTAFSVYLLIGVYVIHIDRGAHLNRVFFLACVSLSVWALGFSIVNTVPDAATFFFWQRVSAVGRSVFYCFFLHFALLFARELRGEGGIRPPLPLLYLPGLVCILVFAAVPGLSSSHYALKEGPFGLICYPVVDAWTILFLVYSLGYVIAAIRAMLRASGAARDPALGRQSRLLALATGLSLLPPDILDFLLHKLLDSPFPRSAPLFPLILAGTVYFMTRRYGFMSGQNDEEELLLDGRTSSTLAYYLSIAFLVGGVTACSSYFLPSAVQSEESLRSMLRAGGLFFLMCAITMVSQFIRSSGLRRFTLLFPMLLSVPAITWQFIEFAGITIWVYPIVMMMVSLLYSSRTPLALVTAVSIATQIPVWINAPSNLIIMDSFDYIARISIFLVAFLVGSFVNKTYTGRLKESVRSANLQRLVSQVSNDLLSVSRTTLNDRVDSVLRGIGEFFQADRCGVFFVDEESSSIAYGREWCLEGISLFLPEWRTNPPQGLNLWLERLSRERILCIEDAEIASEEPHSPWISVFSMSGVKSAVAVPIEEDGTVLGFIGLLFARGNRGCGDFDTDLLKILSNLLADGFIRIRSELEIESAALHDQLTGLPNRAFFMKRLSRSMSRADDNNTMMGLILIDLDGFKVINDMLGHSGGDAVLQELARNLRQRLRQADFVARLGGDEFLVLVDDITDYESAGKIAGHVMGLFAKPFTAHGQAFMLSGSAGVAVYPRDGADENSLLANADAAMYGAKALGKNQYVMCTTEMTDAAKRNQRLSGDLFGSHLRGELTIHYQPQVSVAGGAVSGVEALLRWNHPEMGVVPPLEFIPLAEMNGMMDVIGEWVLRAAVRQRVKWMPSAPPLMRMAVNLSPVQLYNPEFPEKLAAILAEEGLDPLLLELEVTRLSALGESERAREGLKKLSGLGVSVAVDDFGAEYASLGRLKEFRLDRIKIDMQFVHDAVKSERDRTIAAIMIRLAKALGISALAEGVETEAQMDFLREESCDEAQGFHFFRPAPPEEIERLLGWAAGD